MKLTRLASWSLLFGIVAGFGACVWLGHRAAVTSKPRDFVRFHQGISPDTLYYPPFAMMEQLALERWKPGKTLVIVGGNSIFNGVGQKAEKLWSSRLQEMLGPEYAVVNLAFRGSFAAEGAALIAESLQARGIPVLLVVNSSPGAGMGRAIGSIYGYYYWQGLAQGKLVDFAERTADLDTFRKRVSPKKREALDEEALSGRLDAYLKFQSLWHDSAYRHGFTVWNSVTRDAPWRRRELYVDNETPPQTSLERFERNFDFEMRIVREFTKNLAVEDESGNWSMKPATRETLTREIGASLPPALRPRTIAVLTQNAKYYRDRFTPSELARDRVIFDAAAAVWRAVGASAIVVGEDFENPDFSDRTHLTETGGRKVAEHVAAEVRRIHTARNVPSN